MKDIIKELLEVLLESKPSEGWAWFMANKAEKVYKVKKGWFRMTVRVKHLEPLFKKRFGDRP